jgi:hypothetical protein
MRVVAGVSLALSWGGTLGAQAAMPAAPEGLWWDPQKGAVVRLGACSPGVVSGAGSWCGYLVGLPKEGPKNGARPRCGARLFHSFAWDARQQRWAGRISPPDVGRTVSATARMTPDSLHFSARVLFMSRALLFVRYSGTVTAGCDTG